MSEPICIKPLYDARGIPSLCKCWRCREEIKDALAYYREDLCRGPVQDDPFPNYEGGDIG